MKARVGMGEFRKHSSLKDNYNKDTVVKNNTKNFLCQALCYLLSSLIFTTA